MLLSTVSCPNVCRLVCSISAHADWGVGESLLRKAVLQRSSQSFVFFFCVAFPFPRCCFVSVSKCGGAIWQALRSPCLTYCF